MTVSLVFIVGLLRDSSDSFACSRFFSSYWVALSSLNEGFILSYCILFCLVWLLSLGSLLFSEKEMEGNGSGGEGRLEEVRGGRGTMFGIYCMREDSIFSKKENLIFS